MTDTDIEIKKKVEGLLLKFKIENPPVPVEQVAKKLGVLLCPLPADEEISGALVRKDGHVVIAINPTHHRNRQRFTIAHELGHYFFHSGMEEHVDRDFRVNWRRVVDSNPGIDWVEITANRFAAELLMPTRFMKSDLDKIGTIDKRAVTLFAVRYKVSPEAMKIRLSNLGIVGPF
jgi:Zn-dependent peptidase ImmA (M78 family)